MTLISAGELLKSLEFLEQRIQWVKCPFCDDEVSKLRPCNYWNTVGSYVKSYVCVECAECVKGLLFLAGKYPIPGVDVHVSAPEYIRQLGLESRLERSSVAEVFYGDMSFIVSPDGPRLSVLRKGHATDQKKNYDNTYQVWFSLKTQFEKGDNIEESAAKIKKGKW